MILLVILCVDVTSVFANENSLLKAGTLTAVVETTSGPVRGKILDNRWSGVPFTAFFSIRYAKPPVGHLRFKPPVPIEPWTEIFDAIEEKPPCVQYHSNTRDLKGEEDCLKLNVYTPTLNLSIKPTKLKSVMVWIYGGAWEEGDASTLQYDPEFLIPRDVIVVTMNFRVGALGYLNLNHPNATGNAALKDQVLALKWVQANIHNFGGDPDNVTLFGCSTGGMSVGYHILSDASAGLFKAAISMSGVPLDPTSFLPSTQVIWLSEQLGVMLGINTTDREELFEGLYAASPLDILQATAAIRQTNKISQMIVFAPTLENASIATDLFMSDCVLKRYYSGNFTKIPQILGFTEDEMLSFGDSRSLYTVVSDSIAMYNDIGLDVPKFLTDYAHSLPRELTFLDEDFLRAIIKESSEFFYKSGIDQVQKILADYNDDIPVYYYYFTFYTNRSVHNMKWNSPLLGAGHADDVQYIFGQRSFDLIINPGDPLDLTIRRMSTMWTNFAKYGHPTPDWIDDYPLGIMWPNSGPEGLALRIGNDLTITSRPSTKRMEIMEFVQWCAGYRAFECE